MKIRLLLHIYLLEKKLVSNMVGICGGLFSIGLQNQLNIVAVTVAMEYFTGSVHPR